MRFSWRWRWREVGGRACAWMFLCAAARAKFFVSSNFVVFVGVVGSQLTCARKTHFTCASDVGGAPPCTSLIIIGIRNHVQNITCAHTSKLTHQRMNEPFAHAATHLRTQACCYIGMTPSSSKFYPGVAHKRSAMLEWHLPPLNFTLGWHAQGLLCWSGTFLF